MGLELSVHAISRLPSPLAEGRPRRGFAWVKATLEGKVVLGDFRDRILVAVVRTLGRLAALMSLALAFGGRIHEAAADEGAAGTVVDRVVATFYAPEMGGAGHPHFILDRVLAFESRVISMIERSDSSAVSVEERDVREAFDHMVASEILAVLERKVQGDSWGDQRVDVAQIEQTVRDVTEATIERVGGRARLDQVALEEQVDSSEVDALLLRDSLAAVYLDRAVLPILHPTDTQLRDAYRTSVHPFRDRPFDEVRDALSRWLLVGRLRAAETAFLQAAKSRIRIVVAR